MRVVIAAHFSQQEIFHGVIEAPVTKGPSSGIPRNCTVVELHMFYEEISKLKFQSGASRTT